MSFERMIRVLEMQREFGDACLTDPDQIVAALMAGRAMRSYIKLGTTVNGMTLLGHIPTEMAHEIVYTLEAWDKSVKEQK